MRLLARIRGRFLRRLSTLLRVKTLEMRNTSPIVSFTFDDFPRSAALFGAQILESYNARGTFYTAGSLCNKTINGIEYYASTDIEKLNERGHEIAFHTFGHVRASSIKSAELERDSWKNERFFESFSGLPELQNFSYPFGDVSPMTKLRLQKRFVSCRGIHPGMNAGVLDLGLLRATSLYGTSLHPRVSALCERASAENGWLIFYTHDVTNAPSRYGCTPDVFQDAVSRISNAGIQILTVRKALEAIRG